MKIPTIKELMKKDPEFAKMIRKDRMKFGERVKIARKSLGITAERLSEKVGIDRTYISKIENQGWLPATKVVIKLNKVLNESLLGSYMNERDPDFSKAWRQETEIFLGHGRHLISKLDRLMESIIKKSKSKKS